jgi:hypothetical protein
VVTIITTTTTAPAAAISVMEISAVEISRVVTSVAEASDVVDGMAVGVEDGTAPGAVRI